MNTLAYCLPSELNCLPSSIKCSPSSLNLSPSEFNHLYLEKSTKTNTTLRVSKTPSTTCLPRPPVKKIIILYDTTTQTNKSVCDGTTQIPSSTQSKSTQASSSVCNNSSQTSPKFYFPSHRFNLNVEPFNTNISN